MQMNLIVVESCSSQSSFGSSTLVLVPSAGVSIRKKKKKTGSGHSHNSHKCVRAYVRVPCAYGRLSRLLLTYAFFLQVEA